MAEKWLTSNMSNFLLPGLRNLFVVKIKRMTWKVKNSGFFDDIEKKLERLFEGVEI
jgi:hypothetical protein